VTTRPLQAPCACARLCPPPCGIAISCHEECGVVTCHLQAAAQRDLTTIMHSARAHNTPTNAHTTHTSSRTILHRPQPHIITALPCSHQQTLGATGRPAHTQLPPPIPAVHPTLPQRWVQHQSAPPALKSDSSTARPYNNHTPVIQAPTRTHTHHSRSQLYFLALNPTSSTRHLALRSGG
jgi:hypothetical protein